MRAEARLLKEALEAEEGPDNGSREWARYWTCRRVNRRLYEESHPEEVKEDFSAPVLRDGVWNRSDHVSTLLSKGFTTSVDLTLRGKKPRKLNLDKVREKQYIQQMVADGILEVGKVDFFTKHFFLYKPGKLRLIFDGRKLNAAVKPPPKFNMKSHATLANLASKHSWYAGLDLKNMFFSVPINEDCRRFFGVSTDIGDFRYTGMPFGFSWSPFISHIVIDEVIKRALEQGIPCTHYLDDIHIFGDSKEECLFEQAQDTCIAG
jgi:hypothetical protein